MLTFDAHDHVYTLDGAPVRSVTQLLRKVGLINFDDVPPSILETARVRGTIVHQAVHYFNERDLDVEGFCTTFPAYAGYVRSWIRLVQTGRLVTTLCEHMVAHRAPDFAGTFDWIGVFDHHAALIDFATGHPDDASKHLQTAGYLLAARTYATHPNESVLRQFLDAHPFITRYAVRLDRDGGLPTMTPYLDAKDFSKFLAIATAVNVVDQERPQSVPWDWTREPVGVV